MSSFTNGRHGPPNHLTMLVRSIHIFYKEKQANQRDGKDYTHD